MSTSIILHNVTHSISHFFFHNFQVFDRICLPVSDEILAAVTGLLQPIPLEEWLADLETAWMLLIICGGMAFGFGFVYMVLMRCCAGPLVWFLAFISFILVGFFAYFLYGKADEYA